MLIYIYMWWWYKYYTRVFFIAIIKRLKKFGACYVSLTETTGTKS